MSSRVQLIAGLGNPGAKYERTRHNVGFWFVDRLAQNKGVSFRHENKFSGEVAKLQIEGDTVWLIKPMTFMNLSGQAVLALSNFHKIPPEQILVVHDELDIAPGSVRLKQGGGHGGHNGLRDISSRLGNNDYMRIRIGIGHPGSSHEVTNYVLGRSGSDDESRILSAIDEALVTLPQIVAGELQKAMNHLHSHK